MTSAKIPKIALFPVLFPIIILILEVCSTPSPSKKPATCQSCHPTDPARINVHLVPHSHDDVGWLKTVDQYYYGTKKNIQDAGVQFIIGSSIAALIGHPERRFIQVESAFFSKWWQQQHAEMQQLVIRLINAGRLEIVNGAWSMNDEAAAHYHSILDQFTWGFRFLNDSMGECARPKIGWQIDPFGHSREHASLLAQLGFQGLVIGRLDYRDKERRRRAKELDFMWTTSANLNNSNLFTTMFPDFYVSEPDFCFDIVCYRTTLINGDKNSPEYNLDEKVTDFIKYLTKYRQYYPHSHILMPMGGDFNYQAAEINFASIDALIAGFKNHKDYNVFYSTPSCYVNAVNQELNAKTIKLKQKTDDFFPYASEAHGVWAGYFTSRPTSKRYERVGNNILQAVKHLTSFSRVLGKEYEEDLTLLREVMGIMQHHDAITGTEKQAVADDYHRLLTEAIRTAENHIGTIIGSLFQDDDNSDFKLATCLLSNISICEASSKPDRFMAAIYNPLSRPVSHYVRLPVNDGFYRITGPDGDEIHDLVNPISKFTHVKEPINPSPKELLFRARNLPPLGLKLYFIEKVKKASNNEKQFKHEQSNGFELGPNGKLASVTLNGIKVALEQDFGYYSGETYNGNRASGAYIFRPKETEAKALTDKVKVSAQEGNLYREVLQVFGDEISQIIRVYNEEADNYIEFDWLVGDLMRKDMYGREIVTKYKVTHFNNSGVFYTDSNGREQIRRQRNKRLDYEFDASHEPVAGNYYPVTSQIVLKDEERKLEVGVVTDRAQGGGSLEEGGIELMLHRRLRRDDGLGVGEALDEVEYGKGLYARGRHLLTFGDLKKAGAGFRDLGQRALLAPWVLVGETKSFDSAKKMQLEFSGLTRALPDNVQILTLEPWRDNSLLLRLEHVLEKELSTPIVIDLENLFTLFDITEIAETTLGANQWLDDFQMEEKLIWHGYNNDHPFVVLDKKDPLKILLHPMQIRTFLIHYKLVSKINKL